MTVKSIPIWLEAYIAAEKEKFNKFSKAIKPRTRKYYLLKISCSLIAIGSSDREARRGIETSQ
jgi:hypothetical protein